MDTKYDILKKLCEINSISGNEKEAREFIIKEISNKVDDYKIDNLGNIIAYKKGKRGAKKKLMLSAHMDEVGMIVTHVTSNGYLGFTTVGGIDERILCGIHVFIGNNRIPGVIGIKPIHLCSSDEKNKAISIDKLYIDIGAKDKEDALKYVNLGDYVCFDSKFELSGNKIIAKSLDDKVGCCILIDMLSEELEYDTYFAFLVQEEVGLRGAKTATYDINPDAAIVVECTTANDIAGVDEENEVCKLGAGAVISFMDRSTIYDKEYYNLALSKAKQNGINIQIKQAVAGGNDSGAIHTSREGVRTIAVSVPCRCLHSPHGMIDKEDYESVKSMAKLLLKEIQEA